MFGLTKLRRVWKKKSSKIEKWFQVEVGVGVGVAGGVGAKKMFHMLYL